MIGLLIIGAGTLVLELICWACGIDTSARFLAFATILNSLAWLAFNRLCTNWRTQTKVLCFTAVTLWAQGVFLLQTRENIAAFQDWTTFSDDSFYLSNGMNFADALTSAGKTEYIGAFQTITNTPHKGYIALLGHLYVFFPFDRNILVRVAVNINIAVLVVLLGIVLRVASVPETLWRRALLWFLIAGFDLFYTATEVRKDVIILILLVASIWIGSRLAVRPNVLIAISWLALCVGLFYFRNVYVLIPVACMIVATASSRRLGMPRRLLIAGTALGLLFLVYGLLVDSEFYRATSGTWGVRVAVDLEATGNGARLLRIPVLGPVLMGLIMPLPPMAFLFGGAALASTVELLRGLGNICFLSLLIRLVVLRIRTRGTWAYPVSLFALAAVVVFLSGVFGSIEARHKLAVAPCTMICYFFFMYRRNNQRKMMGPLHPAEYVLRACSDSRAGRAEACQRTGPAQEGIREPTKRRPRRESHVFPASPDWLNVQY